MITAALVVLFIGFLFYDQVAPPVLLVLCAVPGLFLLLNGGHDHTRFLPVDVLAQRSRLRDSSAAMKCLTLLSLLVITILSKSPYTGLFLFGAALVLAVFADGLGLHHFIHVLTLPVSFLLAGGLALLFSLSPHPDGVVSIPLPGAWLTVSAAAQVRAALVTSRALGAISCLCFLSVTTPMPEIIGVLRKARCPALVVDLMYLIYRYIFILLSLHHEMTEAAASRLGFRDYRTSVRATGSVYANLLARSYQFAGKNFDAMESRCYDSGIRFMARPSRADPAQIAVCAALILASLLISLYNKV